MDFEDIDLEECSHLELLPKHLLILSISYFRAKETLISLIIK